MKNKVSCIGKNIIDMTVINIYNNKKYKVIDQSEDLQVARVNADNNIQVMAVSDLEVCNE